MKNIYLLISLVILALFNFILLSLYSQKKSDTTYNENITNSINETIISSIIELTHSIIDSSIIFFDEEHNLIELDKRFKNNFLVLYFKESNCMPCVNDVISILNNQTENHNLKDVLIIYQKNSFSIHKSNIPHLVNKNIKIIETNQELFNADNIYNIPFIFVLSEELIVLNILPIIQDNIELITQYLNILIRLRMIS
jgi:hypothetical protein